MHDYGKEVRLFIDRQNTLKRKGSREKDYKIENIAYLSAVRDNDLHP